MSFVPSTCQQLPIMNKIALRVRYPPDYHPQEEPVRLPLGLFNDLLLELQNLSARYLSLNQEFDPTSIALELKVRDKASRSGPKEAAGKQKVESRIQDDEDRNARSDENKMEAKPAGGNDPASSKILLKSDLTTRSWIMPTQKFLPIHSLLRPSIQTRKLNMTRQVPEQSRFKLDV